MARRGRPSRKSFAELIADEVAAHLFAERDRVHQKKSGPDGKVLEARGQQRIGVAFLKTLCERVAQKHGISARTVETYYNRHRDTVIDRYALALDQRLDGVRITTKDQSLRKVSRRK